MMVFTRKVSDWSPGETLTHYDVRVNPGHQVIDVLIDSLVEALQADCPELRAITATIRLSGEVWATPARAKKQKKENV